ncbi:unnamed protein product [Nyctereutes procyonoides]|uniref:(raccoon dog) hypothetical protein n=1 Tax=Nyctereutes procyonoides TaxID=34880 RepID=A0A811YEV0_NYCPR|nr:unnamed protein product [Nyctereutes procyonoides]
MRRTSREMDGVLVLEAVIVRVQDAKLPDSSVGPVEVGLEAPAPLYLNSVTKLMTNQDRTSRRSHKGVASWCGSQPPSARTGPLRLHIERELACSSWPHDCRGRSAMATLVHAWLEMQPWGPPSDAGLGPGSSSPPSPHPGRTAGGRRGVAVAGAGVRPQAPPPGPAGFGTAWPPPDPAPGRAGPAASDLGNGRHSERLLDSEAGPVVRPPAEPGRAARKGQLFMGRLGVLPRPALPSASPEKWGENKAKSSQSWPRNNLSIQQ